MVADPLVVQMVGDGLSGRWLTWRWADGAHPGGVADLGAKTGLADRLSQALPSAAELNLAGPLTEPATELALMQELADALLPAALRAQLLACAGRDLPLHVRVAPSPRWAAVPWGLLPLTADLRLLDVADVSWIGPVLPRDVGADEVRPSPWADVRALEPVHVIDPTTSLGAVLSGTLRLCSCHGQNLRPTSGVVTREGLSTALRAGASRLFLVGHCVTGGSDGDTAFVLSDPMGRAGFGPTVAANRALSAADLTSADGEAAWPMPPRVALVACASGADLKDREPFGLATAILLNGADTVQASLWILPTDLALADAQPSAGGAFAELANAIDHAQGAENPVAELCRWQRDRLHRWRAAPSLATSPLLWGSAMTLTAPPRR